MKKFMIIALAIFPVLFIFDLCFYSLFGMPALGVPYTEGRIAIGVTITSIMLVAMSYMWLLHSEK